MEAKNSPFATHNAKPILYYDDLNADSRASLMLLKLLNVDAELRLINLVQGEHLADAYKDINPAGSVPTLVHNDVVLTGHSILLYVCENFSKGYEKQLLSTDCYKRQLRIINRLFYESRILHRRHGDLMTDLVLKTIDNVNVDYHRKRIETAYDTLESYLQNNEFMAGNMMTLADIAIISTVGALDLMFPLENDPKRWGKLQSWFTRMCAIPVYNIIFNGIEKQREIVEHYAHFTFPSSKKRLSEAANAAHAPRLTLNPEACCCISSGLPQPRQAKHEAQDAAPLSNNVAPLNEPSQNCCCQQQYSTGWQATTQSEMPLSSKQLAQLYGPGPCICVLEEYKNRLQDDDKFQALAKNMPEQEMQTDCSQKCGGVRDESKNRLQRDAQPSASADWRALCRREKDGCNTHGQVEKNGARSSQEDGPDNHSDKKHIKINCICDTERNKNQSEAYALPTVLTKEKSVGDDGQYRRANGFRTHERNDLGSARSRDEDEYERRVRRNKEVKPGEHKPNIAEKPVSVSRQQVQILKAGGSAYGELNMTKVEDKNGGANITLCITVSSGAVPPTAKDNEASSSRPVRSTKSDSRIWNKNGSKRHAASRNSFENSTDESSGSSRKNNNIIRRLGGGIEVTDVTNDFDRKPLPTAPAITIVFPKCPNINVDVNEASEMNATEGREVKLSNIPTLEESTPNNASARSSNSNSVDVARVGEGTKRCRVSGKSKRKTQKTKTHSAKNTSTTHSVAGGTRVQTPAGETAIVAQIATKVLHKMQHGAEEASPIQVLYQNEQQEPCSEQEVTDATALKSSTSMARMRPTTPSTATMTLTVKDCSQSNTNNGNSDANAPRGSTDHNQEFEKRIGSTREEIRRKYPTALRAQTVDPPKLCRKATKRNSK